MVLVHGMTIILMTILILSHTRTHSYNYPIYPGFGPTQSFFMYLFLTRRSHDSSSPISGWFSLLANIIAVQPPMFVKSLLAPAISSNRTTSA